MNNNKLQIAIDGPASAGKSTVAKLIAKRFNYVYCDTGAMYRSVTLNAIKNHIDLSDKDKIIKMMDHTEINFKSISNGQLVFLNGEDVTNAIRQENVTNSVSSVAAIKKIRAKLVKHQQKIARAGNIVMDGRDIGTTVLPNAQVKIFLVASVSERAKRRLKDNLEKGIKVPFEKLKQEIEERDYKDSHRNVSPLKMAKDASKIDTSKMTINQVVDKIADIINQKL